MTVIRDMMSENVIMTLSTSRIDGQRYVKSKDLMSLELRDGRLNEKRDVGPMEVKFNLQARP